MTNLSSTRREFLGLLGGAVAAFAAPSALANTLVDSSAISTRQKPEELTDL